MVIDKKDLPDGGKARKLSGKNTMWTHMLGGTYKIFSETEQCSGWENLLR